LQEGFFLNYLHLIHLPLNIKDVTKFAFGLQASLGVDTPEGWKVYFAECVVMILAFSCAQQG
jgi:hypothetical protein